jgi:hypothetical protein
MRATSWPGSAGGTAGTSRWSAASTPRANLYDAPPAKDKTRRSRSGGRPRLKGRKRAAPADVVERAKAKRRVTVSWYGGKPRRVELISGTGHWYKGGDGLVPVRWVFVRDVSGTHRDEYFYSTDPTLTPDKIVSLYTGRWGVEVTFQEVRRHLGFATPRNWSARSVLRTAPCLLGLFSLVSLTFARHVQEHGVVRIARDPWYAKPEATFADAIATVRRLCWAEVLERSPDYDGLAKLPTQLRATLLDQLSRAA